MAVYAPGRKPYNESFESNITVTEDDVVVESHVNQFDFDSSSFDVTRTSEGNVHILGSGGVGGGNAIAVYNDTELLTSTLYDLTFSTGTDAVRGASPGSVVVTAPGGGGGGTGGQEVVANVTTDGGGGYTISNNSIGIDSCLLTTEALSFFYTTAFADADYFLQVTVNTEIGLPFAGRYPAIATRDVGFCTIRTFDIDGVPINPNSNVISIDIVAQSSPVGSSGGDVTSRETSGTVVNQELAVYAGTTGKEIKGSGPEIGVSIGGTLLATTFLGNTLVGSLGTMAISSGVAELYMTENTANSITGAAGAGRWWVRNEVGAANTPMFTDGAGTEYDLTEGTGGGGGSVDSVVAGTGIAVDDTDTANPIVSSDDSAIVHDNLSGFVAAEHLDWSSDLGGTQIHASNYTSGSGITSWNGLSGAVVSIYVQAADPDITITPNAGDVWIEIP